MQLPPPFLRLVVVLAAFFTVFVSCQSTSGPETPSSTAVTANATATYTEASRLPDSGVWRTNNSSRSDSGKSRVSCAETAKGKYNCSQTIPLKAPLGTDLLFQDAYALGVQFATLTFYQTVSPTELTYKSAVLLPMEEKLVRDFNQARTASATPTPADLVAFYADLLLSDDSLVAGKPLPKGMTADAVRKALVLLASNRDLTASALAGKSLLGLTLDSIHSYMGFLVKAGLIKDTTALYPIAPVRLVDSVRIAGNLVVGEGPVAVTGAFAWNSKWSVNNPVVSIRTADGEDDSVVVHFDKFPDLNSGSWILDGKVTLQAKKGARIGYDTLVVLLKGDSGSATSRTAFQVVRGDSLPPRLDIVSPPDDTIVPNTTEAIVLRAEASDDKGLAYVAIGNRTYTTGPFVDSVDLAVGRNLFVVKAVDLAGNATFDTVFVIRSKSTTSVDTLEPVVTLQAPHRDTIVAPGLSRFDLAWTVSDDQGIRKVTLDDSVIIPQDGIYRCAKLLRDGENSFQIKAFDVAGNVGVKAVVVSRPTDTIRPWITPLPDRSVGIDDSTANLSWSVGNSGKIVSGTLNGKTVPVGPTISATVEVRPGSNAFALVLKDSAGAVYTDTVLVLRAADTTGPDIVWISPKSSTSVDASTSSYALQVKVTDPSGVDSVFIQGVMATKDGQDLYSLSLSLPKPDGNPIQVAVRTRDARGNTSIDSSVSIARKAPDSTDKPVIKLLEPAAASGNVLPFERTTLHVEADITDALLAIDPSTVLFNGTAASRAGSVFSADVPVTVTGKLFTITIKASNANGTTSTLDVLVSRSADTAKPSIERGAGTANRDLPYDSAAATLTWKVTDNHRVVDVRINGTPVAGSSGSYTFSTTSLVVGKNGFQIEAKDSSGNLAFDSVTLTRAWKDTLAPVITRVAGTGPKTVAYEDSILTASWKVSDTLLDEVTIQSGAVSGTAGTYSKTLTLPLGRTLITATAKDLAGHLASDTFSVTRSLGTIPDLVISHVTGNHDSLLHVTIKSGIADATIRYTLDGTDPSGSSTALTYSTAILIDQTRTLKAVATAPDRTPSSVATRTYTMVLPAPVPSLPAGTTADTAFSVDLSCRISGAIVYYTLDGTTPTSSSNRFYIGGINNANVIDSIRTLRAIAIKSGWTSSPVAILPYKANVAVQVYTSYDATAVIRADGSLWTTGRGLALMDGSTGDRAEFSKVMDSVKMVTESHILKLNGDLYAYGSNDSGQFGNGTTISSDNPIFVRSGVKKVDDGRYYSLILDNSNKLYAAGTNSTGSFCNGTFVGSSSYTLVRSGVADIAAGYQGTPYGNPMWTLFVSTTGEAFSCGTGPLGNGSTNQSSISFPQSIGTGFTSAIATDGGSRQSPGSFLIGSTGDAYSTGYNTTLYLIPLTYPSAADSNFVFVKSGVKMIAGARQDVLMLQTNGVVWAAGVNMTGELGDGTQSGADQPKTIMSDVKYIASSGYNSFFIKQNGSLWAAGGNNGLFGDGTLDPNYSPVRIKLP